MSLLVLSSSSSPTRTPSILAVQISEKLTKTIYPLWSAHVLPAIHAAQLKGLLTDDEEPPEKSFKVTKEDKTEVQQPNPAYAARVGRDQAILGYLLSSLTRKTLMHVSLLESICVVL
jgi:hypothetical protein